MANAQILYTDETLQIATHLNLVIIAWSDAPVAEQLREIGRIGRKLGQKHPEGLGLLDLLLSGTPRFSDEVRREAVNLNRDPPRFRLGVADAALISGLAGVAVRAFLSTVRMVARGSVPSRVCGSIGEAAAWLAPRLSPTGDKPTAREIVALAEPIAAARTRRGAA
jgi:hypothetical protein